MDGDVSAPNRASRTIRDTEIEHIVARGEAKGIAPVRSDHPADPHMTDRDGDGVACER